MNWRIIALLLACSCVALMFLKDQDMAQADNIYPDIKGTAAILIDARTGRILYSKNEHRRMSPASLTKIMTALLVLEAGNLDQKTRISEHAAEIGESSIWLETGEILSRRELLYALMLNSANDAAVALAESVSSSERLFVEMMNKKARQLGLRDTHFSNPHGLEDPAHYTSAYDLAFLSRKAMVNPLFQKIVSTHAMTIPWKGHPWNRYLLNKNRLLYRYPGAIGVKTGYTKKAGNCLVGAAQRGSLKLIAVVLNSPRVYDDAAELLDYGFSHYKGVLLSKASQKPLRVRVIKGDSKYVTAVPEQEMIAAVRPGEEKLLSSKVVLVNKISAPVKKGSVLGYCQINLRKKEIGKINLIAEKNVPQRPSFLSRSFLNLKYFLIRMQDSSKFI